jgi:hypothetical protein
MNSASGVSRWGNPVPVLMTNGGNAHVYLLNEGYECKRLGT